jgi:hypothetical protein
MRKIDPTTITMLRRAQSIANMKYGIGGRPKVKAPAAISLPKLKEPNHFVNCVQMPKVCLKGKV